MTEVTFQISWERKDVWGKNDYPYGKKVKKRKTKKKRKPLHLIYTHKVQRFKDLNVKNEMS